MKKIGFIIFGSAIVIGVLFANFVSWGKASGKIINFKIGFEKINGSGTLQTEVRDLKGFDSINVGGVFEVEAVVGKDFSVEVEGDDNLLQYITTEVDGSELRISLDKRVSTKNPLRVRVSAPNIDSLDVSGAANVKLANVQSDEFRLETSGASKVAVSGKTNEFRVSSSGACKVVAGELTAVNADVEASGASSVVLNVSGELTSEASGASSIKYSGSPQNVVKHSSGGSLIQPN